MSKEYNEFVEKFKPKKTTDDCYTPPAVYDVVLKYVQERCDIEGFEVLRPFYPGGDYQAVEYPQNCVVIDNPPFSIISAIIRFYLDRNIKFFLFAPQLTLFSSEQDYTSIVADSTIVYENGAKVKTSFVSNMFGDAKIIVCADLHQRLKNLNDLQKANLPAYGYPPNVVTVSSIAKIVSRGVSIEIKKGDATFCRALEHQKANKKAIFGSGFLVSNKAAAEKAAADKVAADKVAAEKAVSKELTYWQLSEREREVIDQLGTTPLNNSKN